MKKIVKKLLVLTMILTLAASGSVFAKTEGNVYDDAGLLSDEEVAELNAAITELQEESGWNVYAVTTDNAQGKDAVQYADDFFDEHSAGQEDGVVALLDMDNREMYISTGGIAIRYLRDERIDEILDAAFAYAGEEAYGDCLFAMISGVQDTYREGIREGQYNYNEETGEVSRYRSITAGEAGLAVVLALLAGGAAVAVIIGKYRLKFGTYQYAFRDYGEVKLRTSEDRFVNQIVTHRKIEQPQTTSGGGHGSGQSTTHVSSGGNTHGGGGRSF